jgi:hypothetical protein
LTDSGQKSPEKAAVRAAGFALDFGLERRIKKSPKAMIVIPGEVRMYH